MHGRTAPSLLASVLGRKEIPTPVPERSQTQKEAWGGAPHREVPDAGLGGVSQLRGGGGEQVLNQQAGVSVWGAGKVWNGCW